MADDSTEAIPMSDDEEEERMTAADVLNKIQEVRSTIRCLYPLFPHKLRFVPEILYAWVSPGVDSRSIYFGVGNKFKNLS